MDFGLGADAGLASGLELQLNVKGRDDVFACGAGFTAAQVRDDQVEAIKGAPAHCQGSERGFVCECDGRRQDSFAFSCVAALYEACEVQAEAVDGSSRSEPFDVECEALASGVAGRCVQSDDDGYSCACGEGAGDELSPGRDAVAASPVACEQALFESCAEACEGDFGACAPSDSGVLGEYSCTCSTNRFTQGARAASCAQALRSACDPTREMDSACTGYGGACVVADPAKPDELTCTCVDRSIEVVDYDPASSEPRYRACRKVLEATCGLGSPPDGAQCAAEGNGYAARCTRGPAGDAELTCECYPQDGHAQARVDTVSSHDCDMATLMAFCPELED